MSGALAISTSTRFFSVMPPPMAASASISAWAWAIKVSHSSSAPMQAAMNRVSANMASRFSAEGISATQTPMSRRGWKGSAPAEALIPEVNTRSASKTAIRSVSGSIMSKVGSSSRPKYMAE